MTACSATEDPSARDPFVGLPEVKEEQPEPKATGRWIELLTLHGGGPLVSERFNVSSKATEWRTCWDYMGEGYFGLYLLESPDAGAIEFIGDNFGRNGPASGCRLMKARVGAHYYLEVNMGRGAWRVWAESRR